MLPSEIEFLSKVREWTGGNDNNKSSLKILWFDG